MADSTQPPVSAATTIATTQTAFSSTFVIPDDIKAQFPELTELIAGSESMNDEERQYWVNILPVMTPEQIENLKGILTNERQQLAAIDAKYEKEISQIGQGEFLKQVDQERKARRQERTSAENQAKATEDSAAEDLLKQIDQI